MRDERTSLQSDWVRPSIRTLRGRTVFLNDDRHAETLTSAAVAMLTCTRLQSLDVNRCCISADNGHASYKVRRTSPSISHL